MKNLFFVSVAFSIFSGTSLSATAQKNRNFSNDGTPTSQSPKFIEGIEVKADHSVMASEEAILRKQAIYEPAIAVSNNPGEIEKSSTLQFKYAQLLNRDVEQVDNLSLYRFIDEWWQTRYRYGGSTKKGIDCSALTGLLMGTVFGIKLPRTAKEQYNACSRLEKDEMEEGDLVFFNTTGGISHVGVFLGDGYFVHASRNSGVTISSLEDPYYSKRFISGGKLPQQYNGLTRIIQ